MKNYFPKIVNLEVFFHKSVRYSVMKFTLPQTKMYNLLLLGNLASIDL